MSAQKADFMSTYATIALHRDAWCKVSSM